MERRNSDDAESSRRLSNPDVFDDDYEIDPDENDFMPSVSDGFRPANASEGMHSDRQDHDRNDALQRHASISNPTTNDHERRRTATRNSMAKVRDPTPQDSRPPVMHNRGPSNPSSLAHRASVSSTASFATTSNGDNPFEMSTGPSHPYGMYPQNTMARTPSVATASTGRQPHRSMSLQRPTHPYAMYSQSGLPEELDDEAPLEPAQPPVPPIQTAIPLGFPGLGTGYHRVLGPDGEEQDIIGPDGHTEQLPPYSRYPDEGPTKASLAAEASASRIVPAPNTLLEAEDPFNTPVSPVSPQSEASFSAPALPSAPLLPAVTPARLPPQRPETQTGNVALVASTYSAPAQVPAEPSDSSSASLLLSEQSYSEKEKAEHTETKTSWRRKKLWGKIPMGVVVVVFILLLVFAIALGAAIGTFVAKKHNRNKGGHRRPSGDEPLPQMTGTHGSLYDATPIPTPSGLGFLPTGAFSLPLGIPQESNPGCLTQANQYSAWSCKLTFAPLVVTINTTMTDDCPRQLASMKTGSSVPDSAILYGLQSPNLMLEPMQLVLDLDYKAYGPAYHFATRYDKLVILRPEELNAGSGLRKRQDGKNFRQRFQVRPGDLPWYCFWNNTYIEGYIYVEDNSTAASYTAFPTQPPSGSPSASYDVAGFLATASSASPFSLTGILPSSSPTAAATPAPVSPRDAQSDASAPPRIPPYPRIVKIEERRTANSGQPYCQQMVLLDNGKIAPATNGNDGPKKIYLQEVDPNYDDKWSARPSQTGNSKREADLRARSDPSSACHCQWMFK